MKQYSHPLLNVNFYNMKKIFLLTDFYNLISANVIFKKNAHHVKQGTTIPEIALATPATPLTHSLFDISAIITDWKYASVSSPNADLAYFFLSSTNQSMREKHTQDWLEQYYFSFTECLRSKFGIKLASSHTDFDFDVFKRDFQKHLQRAYLQVISGICCI